MSKLVHTYEVCEKIAALSRFGYEVGFGFDIDAGGKIHARIFGAKKPSFSGFADSTEEALARAMQQLIADLAQQRKSHQAAIDKLDAEINLIETYSMYKVRMLEENPADETETEAESAA